MNKKIIPVILISAITVSSTVHAFLDTENHWAKNAIDEFGENNIIKGYEDDTFRPDNYMTRAEVVTVINRMLGLKRESLAYIPDIARQDWYYSEIRKAMKSGIIKGDENGYIKPNDNITREEAIVMLARAFKITTDSVGAEEYTDANSVSDWAKNEVRAFYKLEYINGYADGEIKPKESITRAEFVTILNRIFTKVLDDSGIYSDIIQGNVIVNGKNIVLKDLTITGDLVISEGTKETMRLKNVSVGGNLIIRENIEKPKEIKVNGRTYNLYVVENEETNKYKNDEYGIEFSLPNDIEIIEKWKTEEIDYKKENTVILDIKQSDEYYTQSINTIGKKRIKSVDELYVQKETGIIEQGKYILYNDVKTKNGLLVVKRDNTVYYINFCNIETGSLTENVLSTLKLIDGEKIKDRKTVTYKNNKLNLKFMYKEGYIGVDDSYNTNKIYSGDAPIRLFIQVNTITDMQDYSLSEIKYLLKASVKEDGELKKTETLKIFGKDAVKFEIYNKNEQKTVYSLYIIVGNTLYNMTYRANEEVMKEVGADFFKDIVDSIEF